MDTHSIIYSTCINMVVTRACYRTAHVEGYVVIEIAAAVSMAGSAYNGIKRAIEMGKEAQDVAHYFSKFFDAKESVLEASVENSSVGISRKLFSGSSVEAQALEITAAKHKTQQLEKELREFLLYSGQYAFYEDMMAERRRIRESRLREAKLRAERRAFWTDLLVIGVAVVCSVAIIGAFWGWLAHYT